MTFWQDALKFGGLRLPFLVGGVFIALSVQSFAFFSSDIEVFTDEERLRGFIAQQNKNLSHDKKREAGAAVVKKRRRDWSEALDQSVADYKAWKLRQKKSLDESSPEYASDLNRRKSAAKKMEELERFYVMERNKKQRLKKQNVHLTEEHELGLDQKEEPADFRKRALYFSDKQKKEKNTIGAGASGGVDLNSPPPEFNPPMTQPPAPEFYEPEIPPPPPPPPPEFDEAIPPPIFDDVPPEF